MNKKEQAQYIIDNEGECPPCMCNECVNKRGQNVPCTNEAFAILLAKEYLYDLLNNII